MGNLIFILSLLIFNVGFSGDEGGCPVSVLGYKVVPDSVFEFTESDPLLSHNFS